MGGHRYHQSVPEAIIDPCIVYIQHLTTVEEASGVTGGVRCLSLSRSFRVHPGVAGEDVEPSDQVAAVTKPCKIKLQN